MEFWRYSASEAFFNCSEPLIQPENSWRGRWLAARKFFEKLAIIPVAFLCKLLKTFGAALGLSFSAAVVIFTLFSAPGARSFFVQQIASFASELADWILWPIGVTLCISRILLATVIHPALYFGV